MVSELQEWRLHENCGCEWPETRPGCNGTRSIPVLLVRNRGEHGVYALEDPATVKENRRARRQRHVVRMRAKIDALKAAPCADCGRTYPPYVMDFDHRDPSAKVAGVGKMALTRSWAAIQAEIAKCDLVCANCHRERTYGA